MPNRSPIIAVIDTGISADVSFLQDVVGNISFYIEGDAIYIADGNYDIIGHGTKVTSCMKQYCPQAKLFIINIYQNNLVTSSELLLEALKYLLTVDVDMINISLAVNSEENVAEINNVLMQLCDQGKIIVASVKNGLKSSFPAESPYCIGVLGKKDIPIGKFIIDDTQTIQITTSVLPEQVETLQGQRNLFGGNSKAAACTTGCIASIMVEKGKCRMRMNTVCQELLRAGGGQVGAVTAEGDYNE